MARAVTSERGETVVLVLSYAEARALAACAEKGFEQYTGRKPDKDAAARALGALGEFYGSNRSNKQ